MENERREKLFLIWSLMVFILATFLFVKAYRDIDTAYNLNLIKFYTNVSFCDGMAFNNDCYASNELYLLGLKELFISFLFFFISISIATFNFVIKRKEFLNENSK
jgi:hypothetical protein